LKEAWNNIIDIVLENSKVLDAGCSTGSLALLLAEQAPKHHRPLSFRLFRGRPL
jgi:2-polyprenyl-3-methyl-5-hydroxy-6-metoxy-1,4-benzoquinol methylase